MPLRTRIERAVARAFVRLPTPVLRSMVGPARRSPEGYVLDLEIQSLVWLMTLRNGAHMGTHGLHEARRLMDHTGSLLASRVRGVSVRDLAVRGGDGDRPARIYRPEAARGAGTPGLVWFHGGGFVIGSIESHDGICRRLAKEAGVVVLSVDYRLAPEHPFPAAVHDAVAATRWVVDNAATLGIHPRAIAVGGDSAGGNLAAVTAHALRTGPHRPAFQLLIYPATDFTRGHPSHTHFNRGLVLTKESMDWFTQNYLPSKDDVRDPRASCIFADDLAGLPPAFVLTAGFDPLRDEGRAYAERMRAAGVVVEHHCSEAAVHGFLNMAGSLSEPSRMLTLAAQRLRRGLSGAARSAVAVQASTS
jgi:acetyl esterase